MRTLEINHEDVIEVMIGGRAIGVVKGSFKLHHTVTVSGWRVRRDGHAWWTSFEERDVTGFPSGAVLSCPLDEIQLIKEA